MVLDTQVQLIFSVASGTGPSFVMAYSFASVAMQVQLLDGSLHEADPLDVALLSRRTELNIPSIYSKDIFYWFAAFVKRQDLDLDQKLIDQWNDQFVEEIKDTDTLHDFIMLAWRTNQMKLLDVCSKRAADMLKGRLSGDAAELLNLPNLGDDEDEEGDGDEHDDEGDGDEHDDEEDGDDDGNDPDNASSESENDDMDVDE